MRQFSLVFAFILGFVLNGFAQKSQLDTVGITNGSVHMTGTYPYTKFLPKYKGDKPNVTIHIWYNPSGSSLTKKEVTVGKDEICLLYGRNLKTANSEMDFKFGSNAKAAYSKKKEKELTELVDFFAFEVFKNQNFNTYTALEALQEALE